MTFLKRLGLGLLPAALFGLYSARPGLVGLNLVVLVPWVVLYTDDRHRKVSWVWYSLGAWISWALLHHSTFRFGWYVPFVMGLVLGFFWHPFAPMLRRVHHRLRLPRSLTVAVLWVAVEWLRVTFTLANFDIYQVGYSMAPFTTFVQIADITGIYGVSLWVAAFNGWWADVFFAWRDGGGPRAALRSRSVRGGLTALATVALAFWGYGAIRLHGLVVEPGPKLALIQPNLPHSQRNVMSVHLAQMRMTLDEIEPGSVDLIVWPENAILYVLPRDPAYVSDLAWLAEALDAPILVGAQGAVDGAPAMATNSAYLVERGGSIQARYDKQVLFPWSEFIPGDRLFMDVWPAFGRLHRLIARVGWGSQANGIRGDRTTLFDLDWDGTTTPFATLICVENTNPRVPAEAGRLGAGFFINITNEGAVGGPTQEQLLRTAMFRAIENRMAYVRLGNTGISGMIDPAGRLTALLRGEGGRVIYVPGSMVERVPLAPGARALYPRSRDAFAMLVVIVAVGLVLATFVPRRRGGAAAVALVVLGTVSGCGDPGSLGRDPSRADGALAAGRTAMDDGRLTDAVDDLRAACATPEGCREALPWLASAYDRLPFDDDAVVLFGSIAERYPALAGPALAQKGVFLEKTLDTDAAEAAYRASLSDDPDPTVRGRLALLLLRSGRRDEALDVIDAGLARHPDHPGLLLLLGRARREQGRLDASREILDQVVARADGSRLGVAWVELGRTLEALGDVDGAIAAWEAALAADPDSIPARFHLVRQALRRGEFERADRWIDEMHRLDGTIVGH